MIKNKLRFNDIVAESYYLNENNQDVIIFCSGIPGTSSYEEIAKKYVEKGFIFIHPKYIGSWESYGNFSINGCKKTIVDFVNALLEKKVKTIFGDDFNIKINKIFLLGHSFGGSVALCSGGELNVSGIIAISPVIDYKKHAKENFKEEKLDWLYDFLKAGFENVYRSLNKNEWGDFCNTGLELNANDYLKKIKNKKILLMHGINDKSVNYKRSDVFYLALKELGGDIVYDKTNDDHSSIKLNSFQKIISWIEK